MLFLFSAEKKEITLQLIFLETILSRNSLYLYIWIAIFNLKYYKFVVILTEH
jgi:hypothetical protein